MCMGSIKVGHCLRKENYWERYDQNSYWNKNLKTFQGGRTLEKIMGQG